MKQGPKFGHAVLDGRTGQEQTIPCLEVEQSSPPTTVDILDSLRLVQYHVVPFDFLKALLLAVSLMTAYNQVV